MKKTLYLECQSGISGDMMAAALLDLGADEKVLREALETIPVSGYEIHISRVKKAGLDMCDFDVALDKEHENHDHDMKYLHGHEHGNEAAHEHGNMETHADVQENEETHGSGHEHENMKHKHAHMHEHRGLSEILNLIEQSEMTGRAKKTASDIFTILAEAEAKAHGVSLEKVHFHEVGAVDSIVDIVAVAVCLDNLNITEVIVEELYEGRGTIRCQHGILPVPVPAVVNIAEKHGLRLHITETHGELVTPTGAAIAAAITTSQKLPKQFVIEKTGMGAGKRKYDRPGMLRAMLIKAENPVETDEIYKLETNIDDATGEMLGFVMERLLEAGARDVNYMPLYMKKNRPAYQLNVICKEEDVSKMERIIFRETTTIGIRKIKMERSVLKRQSKTVVTPLGEVKVKICELPDGVRVYPEYEDAVKLCKEHDISYYEICRLIQKVNLDCYFTK